MNEMALDLISSTTKESMTFVKDAIKKVRSQEWAEPVGIAMGGTASILQAFT